MPDSESGFRGTNVSQIPRGPAWTTQPAVPRLKPKLQSQNWRPFKYSQRKPQLLHPQFKHQRKKGGKIVSIFHINTDLTAAARNVWVKRGLTVISAQTEPLLKIHTRMCSKERQQQTPLLWNAAVCVSKRLFKKRTVLFHGILTFLLFKRKHLEETENLCQSNLRFCTYNLTVTVYCSPSPQTPSHGGWD